MGTFEVRGTIEARFEQVLTREALDFVASLHRALNPAREKLLRERQERQAELDRGGTLDFLPETKEARAGDWRIAPVPEALEDRRVEITGPTDRKMMINALNSGAEVFMADLEDANVPVWSNMVEGQVNLFDAVRRTLEYRGPDGRQYALNDRVATLVLRPRGLHLVERHLLVDGEPVSGSLFDFGLYVFHNARELISQLSGPFLYLPKIEGHREARLWNEAFLMAERDLGLSSGTIKATVLIETITAAFEMDEILHELREHSAGLNAGRWDYIFSIIKKFRHRPEFVLPNRAQITMTTPFMRTYAELLVRTCHRRRAHAIGGMAAFVPSRKDPAANRVAFERVRVDKVREADQGFDGTWVAHPDLVAVARRAFDEVLGSNPHQIHRVPEEWPSTARRLLDVHVPGGDVTLEGLRNNITVAVQYLDSWLDGVGAAAIFSLMEDTATAEIARAQIWQWVRHHVRLGEGIVLTLELVQRTLDEELAKLRKSYGSTGREGRFERARSLLEVIALREDLPDFLTIAGYELLD